MLNGRTGDKLVKAAILSSFILKIAAIVTMTLDHLGLLMYDYFFHTDVALIFRDVGRIALPLFCFMVAEGVTYTKSFKKYIARMAIIAAAVLAAQIFMEYVMKYSLRQGNIFFDLIVGAVIIKLLSDKKIYIRLLALLPALFSVACYFAFAYEEAFGHRSLDFFPYFLRLQYPFYSTLMITAFFLSKKLAEKLTAKSGESAKRLVSNVFAALVVVIATLINFGVEYAFDHGVINGFSTASDYYQQNFAMLAGVLLLFYSGKRGYNAKWFKYGQYLYYPLHILALFGIFTLAFGY